MVRLPEHARLPPRLGREVTMPPEGAWTSGLPSCHAEPMKAVVYTRYGSPDVLRLTDVDTPVPGDGEVLVKVRAVSLNRSDWESLRGKPLYSRFGGPFRPRLHVLGSDIVGRVEAVGPNVTGFAPGDDVFADALSHL